MGHSTVSNKDKRHHEKIKTFQQEVGALVCMITGRNPDTDSKNWDEKKKLVIQAKEKLNDLQFLWERLRSLRRREASQVPKERFGEKFEQILDALKQMLESIRELHVSTVAANMIGRVVHFFSDISAHYILSEECTNQDFTSETKREELRLNFSPTPDFSQINQQGNNAEVDNQEMRGQEKQGKEVILTIGLLPERLAELKLEMKETNQKMDLQDTEKCANYLYNLPEASVSSSDLHNCVKGFKECITGTSNAAANEANVMLSADETRIFKRYKVFGRNFNVLTEIFEKEPNIDEKFRVADPYFQSVYMNSLAEVYQKIKSEPEMLEPEVIKSMKLKVRDMKRVGLQLSWLKRMLDYYKLDHYKLDCYWEEVE